MGFNLYSTVDTSQVNISISRQYLYHSAILLLESQIEISEVLSSKDIKPFPHSHLEREKKSEEPHYWLVV